MTVPRTADEAWMWLTEFARDLGISVDGKPVPPVTGAQFEKLASGKTYGRLLQEIADIAASGLFPPKGTAQMYMVVAYGVARHRPDLAIECYERARRLDPRCGAAGELRQLRKKLKAAHHQTSRER